MLVAEDLFLYVFVADLHDFVFCFGFGQNQNKTFFVLQWYFDLSKQKVFVLVFVLTKPKQNRADKICRDVACCRRRFCSSLLQTPVVIYLV